MPHPAPVTLTHAELTSLLEQAAARGAALALRQQPTETLNNAEAAAFIYGRGDRIECFRQLLHTRPELKAASTGTGAGRRWTRAALEDFVAKNPKFRRKYAEQAA